MGKPSYILVSHWNQTLTHYDTYGLILPALAQISETAPAFWLPRYRRKVRFTLFWLFHEEFSTASVPGGCVVRGRPRTVRRAPTAYTYTCWPPYTIFHPESTLWYINEGWNVLLFIFRITSDDLVYLSLIYLREFTTEWVFVGFILTT